MAVVDRFKAIFDRPIDNVADQDYTSLEGHEDRHDLSHTPHERLLSAHDVDDQDNQPSPFSWLEYFVFLLLGVAMLWAWNMYLAAAPYFAHRFRSNDWILEHFQSSIISVGTLTNLCSMLLLANLQAKASYPGRVALALVINIAAFTLLALSTIWFTSISSSAYLGFILASVFCTSVATGLVQNGAFALASGFGHPSYTQAIMVGQAIAGVLPPIAQIVSVLAVPASAENGNGPPIDQAPPKKEGNASAFVYFLTATIISALALMAFIPLIRRHAALSPHADLSASIVSFSSTRDRKTVPLRRLYVKLRWFAAAVFMCFAVTMFFPVYTSQTLSSQAPDSRSRLFEPPTFIPLAFLFWNTGDLLGRLSTLLPSPFSIARRPYMLFAFAILRALFLPLYLLCNIRGQGAIIGNGSIWGDLFYLLVVQLCFGFTNGWLGSKCMMGAGQSEDVEDGEKEVVGGFMGLNLVAGLTVGSLLSFGAGGHR